MAEKPIMHGRDHRAGGYDPIPGIGGLPVGMARRTGTVSISAHTSTALTWQQSAISDHDYYSWTSGTNLEVLRTGIYMSWFGIVADADWPAAADGYIDWLTQVSGAGNSVVQPGLQPFGAHTNIDVYSPAFAPSGTISAVSFLHISSAPCNLTGVVDNETASSFVVGSLATMAVYRLCEVVDFA